MARGWESKSVESQQEQPIRAQASDKQVLTPEERDRRSRRGTLMLARARATADLTRATTPAHRSMLERALADIDKQLRES